jgi:hypothetical protein
MRTTPTLQCPSCKWTPIKEKGESLGRDQCQHLFPGLLDPSTVTFKDSHTCCPTIGQLLEGPEISQCKFSPGTLDSQLYGNSMRLGMSACVTMACTCMWLTRASSNGGTLDIYQPNNMCTNQQAWLEDKK